MNRDAALLPAPNAQPPAAVARHLLISAGEPSGDRYAAAVVRALESLDPRFMVDGFGGPLLRESGARINWPMDQLSVVGFWEVLSKVPAHARYLRAVHRSLTTDARRLALLVDYPGFNLRVARHAHRHHVPVLYYIAPQLWAWGERRASELRRLVSHLAVILPFEEAYFTKLGIRTSFVGHPLMDRPVPPDREAARRLFSLGKDSPTVALSPGSRTGELQRHWAAFRETAKLIRAAVPESAILVAGVGDHTYPGAEDFVVVRDRPEAVLSASDVALCKSGTATLEAALTATPMVIAYKTHPVSYQIARRVIRCPHIGLANLLLDRRVAPEYVQHDANPHVLSGAVLSLLDAGGAAARSQRDALAAVPGLLGRPGVADRVAALALEIAGP